MPAADAVPAALATPPARRWPGQCQVCRGWAMQPLCRPCRARYTALRPRCRRCALPLDGGADTCGECLLDPPPFARTYCVGDYGFPWSGLVGAFKFDHRPELAGLLADAVAAAARAQGAAPPALFVPVPLSERRLAARGYDQAWELARRLGPATATPASARLLVRRFDDATPQSERSRAQRLAAVRGAFVVDPRRGREIAGRAVALVDDVVTTGATARAAAQALLDGGASRVDVWVVARTAGG